MTSLMDLLHDPDGSVRVVPPIVQRKVVVWTHILDQPVSLDDAVATVGPLGHLFVWRWTVFQLRAGHPAKFPVKVYAPGAWTDFEHQGPAFDLPTEYPAPPTPDWAAPAVPSDPFDQLDADRLDREHGEIDHKTGWSDAAANTPRASRPLAQVSNPAAETRLLPAVRDDEDRAYQSAEGSRRVAVADPDEDDGGWRPRRRTQRLSPETRERVRGQVEALQDHRWLRTRSVALLAPTGLPSIRSMALAGAVGFVLLWFTLKLVLS